MPQTDRSTGKIIDRLVSVEVRPKGLPTVWELYEAATDAEDEPLSYAAARALQKNVDVGDTVIIASGANGPPWFPRGETDGPLGAVVLARALTLALGARPVLVTEERNRPPLEAAARACELNVVPYDHLESTGNAVTVVPYTEDSAEAETVADEFMDRYDPSAIAAIEKLGPNPDGIVYSLMGENQSAVHAKIGPLFDRAHDAGVLTVGFGDGGNEIGMAKIRDAVYEFIPTGETVCTRIATDKLVVAGSSNWGAYGVAAMLAILEETPGALHTPEDESRMLEHAMLEGLADSLTARPMTAVDGMEEPGLRGIVAILNNLVRSRLTEIDRTIREWDRARE